MKRSSAWLLILGLVACGPLPVEGDAGSPDSGALDSGVITATDAGVDGGPVVEDDAGRPDAGGLDAGLPDAGGSDAGGTDAGVPDAGPFDAGLPDAGQDAGPPATNCAMPTGSEPPFTIRVMAANLSSGNAQSYDLGHGARIMKGVQPDVVAIQEFNYGNNSTTAIRGFVDDTFGTGFSYARSVSGQQIPNGVISRWAILDSGEWTDASVSNRKFTWAHIDLPGPNDLWVVSVHLLTANASTRNTEAAQLVGYLNANVPRYDYVIVGGDFNTDTRSEPAFTTFSSRFTVSLPQPADQSGNGATNASRMVKPYDNVLSSPCLSSTQVPTVIGAASFDAGAVIDTRVFMPISDLAPALASDSDAASMQHMGVVKDFLISP